MSHTLRGKKGERAQTASTKPPSPPGTSKDNMATATDNPSYLPEDLEKLRFLLINDLKKTIDEALAPLSDAVNKIQEVTEDHANRIVELERALSDYSDRVVHLEGKCATLEKKNSLHDDAIDALENRSRRCNLKVVGLSEKIEGKDAIEFMSGFFAETLGEIFPSPPPLDRAHRLGPLRSEPDSKPRPMIVSFHRYQDKERALRVSRDKLIYRGQHVIFYPDYSAIVNKKRAAFNPVKALLYRRGVKFRLVFPAVLKVEYNGVTHSFITAEEAQKFCDHHVKDA